MKMAIFGVAGLVGGAALALAVYIFVLGGSGKDAEAAEAEAKPVHVEGKLGPHVAVADRIYNLSSSGSSRHFVKMTTIVEFETTDKAWFDLKGDVLETALEEFGEEIGTGRVLIEDAITRIVASKRADEISTAEGTDALRAEIKNAVAGLIAEPRVYRVFFTTFIVD